MLKKLVLLLACGWLGLARGAEPEHSVIQIFTFAQQPVWDAPWRFDAIRRMGGSGFIIKGKRIMTNAHVVSWGKQVIVRRYQDPRPYLAEAEFLGHDCDLAVLTVKDSRFFEDLEPLELGDLPKVRSTVVTYGYPAGGEEISYTRGVVSRIELETYSHAGNRRFLTVQTDAAINPGNSGGPVIQDNKVVGVAFQGVPGLENTGFFIPTPVIHHFLKDIEDGRYDGFGYAGIRVIPLQNPAYRRLLGLPDNDAGARVDGILPIASTQEVLRMDDVILKIGSFGVSSDGTVLYQGNRVSAAFGFQLAQHGERVPMEVWREGKLITLDLPIYANREDRATGYQYDTLPRYFVYGGLVFTPLSLDYLRTLGRNVSENTFGDAFYELFYRKYEEPEKLRPEPIVLASVLADAVNANLTVRGRALVDRINGRPIHRLEDVISALDQSTNSFDLIEFLPRGSSETLERAGVAEANPGILKTYGLASDRRL